MKRSNFLITIVALAIICIMTNCTTNPSTGDKPNIIYIMLDELGYYELSCMGHELLQTPNIDRMAEEGMRFTNAFHIDDGAAPGAYNR